MALDTALAVSLVGGAPLLQPLPELKMDPISTTPPPPIFKNSYLLEKYTKSIFLPVMVKTLIKELSSEIPKFLGSR